MIEWTCGGVRSRLRDDRLIWTFDLHLVFQRLREQSRIFPCMLQVIVGVGSTLQARDASRVRCGRLSRRSTKNDRRRLMCRLFGVVRRVEERIERRVRQRGLWIG